MSSLLKYKKTLREDYMRRCLITLLFLVAFGVPYIALADDYDSGVKATLILKTTTTTNNYPVKHLNTQMPEITAMKVEIKPGAETGWHLFPFTPTCWNRTLL
jgi:hypothetical protein